MDLIRDFAYPLPVAVIGDLLGVPAGDHEQLKAWSDELAGFIGSSLGSSDKYERAARGVAEMRDYFGASSPTAGRHRPTISSRRSSAGRARGAAQRVGAHRELRPAALRRP